MSLKDNILEELKNNRDFISGQALADKYNVSRGAIWKSINTLKKDGYVIDSVTNKGYKILSQDNVISSDEIKLYLGEYSNNINIQIFDSIDSTNTKLKSMATEGAPEHTLIIANHQTNGHGRFGRNFYSPSQTGTYFSLLLKPDFNITSATLITSMTAVAICKSIELLTGKTPGIKWINDIYLDNKKIAGILTEASTDFETGMIHYIIIGIGINISTKDFPDEIADKAGSLGENISKNKLISSIISNIYDMYYRLPDSGFINTYRHYSIMIGKSITYKIKNVTHTGTVTGIDDFGGLIVLSKNGDTVTLTSGEVTILSF